MNSHYSKKLFHSYIKVFKSYVDDPRNTDHAWIETIAMNYHDDSGEIFNKIKLQVNGRQSATWYVVMYVLASFSLISGDFLLVWVQQHAISLAFPLISFNQAGDDATAVRWQRVSGNIPLYANHVAILENVANRHNANFWTAQSFF